MTDRPDCYPAVQVARTPGGGALPRLDVLTSPVPQGRFDSPLDGRHVLCLHLGKPVPVTWRAGRQERRGTRLHGQFCVVPAGSSTRWTLSAPATSLLLRLSPGVLGEAAEQARVRSADLDLVPHIHIRDPHVERIGWMMQAEAQAGHPSGRLFADSLATALAARLFALQTRPALPSTQAGPALPAWRLRHVVEYIDAHLDGDLGLAELAAEAGFGISHFSALFRRATGVSVHQFVLERRVERARLLLAEGRLNRTQVALEAGFAHASHMARVMRRVLGMGPGRMPGL